jgi:catechol 2,3-dioxygenase-like lactoylglutathione lyase family enzyme
MSNPALDYPITFLYTRDLNITAEFYENVIGLALARDQGDCRIYRVGECGYIGFCQQVNTLDVPLGVILTLVTPDVDGWFYRLSEKGVTFDQPPSLSPKYNIYHCFLHDPNGYLIEIQRFNEPL